MSNQKIEQLIEKLSNEVQHAELDDSTIAQLRAFERGIEPYLNNNTDNNTNSSLLDQAKALEVEFAQRHPVAEGIIQEIIDSLSKMGI